MYYIYIFNQLEVESKFAGKKFIVNANTWPCSNHTDVYIIKPNPIFPHQIFLGENVQQKIVQVHSTRFFSSSWIYTRHKFWSEILSVNHSSQISEWFVDKCYFELISDQDLLWYSFVNIQIMMCVRCSIATCVTFLLRLTLITFMLCLTFRNDQL
jgi:hypothetical protein